MYMYIYVYTDSVVSPVEGEDGCYEGDKESG